MAIKSLDELKRHARGVHGSRIGRALQSSLSRLLELVSIALAVFFVVLDAELLRVGSRIVVWEEPIYRHVKEVRELQDERLTMLLEIATVGLILGAILLVVLAWILAASRRTRTDVARLCEGVEKLRDPTGR